MKYGVPTFASFAELFVQQSIIYNVTIPSRMIGKGPIDREQSLTKWKFQIKNNSDQLLRTFRGLQGRCHWKRILGTWKEGNEVNIKCFNDILVKINDLDLSDID